MWSLEQRKETLDQVAAMRKQEDLFYKKTDYLSKLDGILNPSGKKLVDADCRFKMVLWCFQVVEYCKFNRETASISFLYLDQFLGTEEGELVLYDRSSFQLAAMISLELAVKIHEPKELNMHGLSELSKGTYSIEQLVLMERKILMALNWRMHPPTAISFANLLLELLPTNIPTAIKNKIKEFSMFQIELSVKDYFLVVHKSSTIALASILNATDSLYFFRLSKTAQQSFNKDIILATGIDPTDFLTYEVRKRLKQLQLSSAPTSFHSLGTVSNFLSLKKNQEVCPSSPFCVSSLEI